VAELDWRTALLVEDERRDYGEPRIRVFALRDGRLHIAVVTPREDALRVISFRRASRKEAKYMLNTKRPDPERPDDDNAELSLEELQRARPASGEKATRELLQPRRVRSPKDDQKVSHTLCIGGEVLEALAGY
jgi:hypothetical protein